MVNALTQRAERILNFDAPVGARRFNSPYVEPEHILYAVIGEQNSAAKAALDFLQIDTAGWRRELESIILTYEKQSETPALGIFSPVKMPASERTRAFLSNALRESRLMGHGYVGTEHLLLTACIEKDSHAAAFFARQRADTNLLRFMVQTSFNHETLNANEPIPVTYNNAANEILQGNAVTTASGEAATEAASAAAGNAAGEAAPAARTESPFTRKAGAAGKPSTLETYTADLTALARQGKLDPVIGREKELERIVHILSRRAKNNPVLIGEPGTGKTALAEALARLIVSAGAPAGLAEKRLLALDIGAVVAGTEYRGQFERRVKEIIAQTEEAGDIILFIDEIHTIVGAGRASGTLDAGNMFKPALSRGRFQCVGATTIAEYRKYFEKDAALERRFQIVRIDEPGLAATERILAGIKTKYEEYHGVRFTAAAVTACARLAGRYISGRNMPDKAIDLLDETAAAVKLKTERRRENRSLRELPLVTEDDVRETAAALTGIHLPEPPPAIAAASSAPPPAANAAENTGNRQPAAANTAAVAAAANRRPAMPLPVRLKNTVVGQDEAVDTLCKAVLRSRAGISPDTRPRGAFLFLGPSGCGKTLLAKALAQELYGTGDALIRIDMSDYMEKHSASRLAGAPPGYVGYDEGGVLTERVRRRPASVILLDEAEKAHPDVFNLFLQVFEEGELEDNFGRKVSFRHAFIILTSNAGMDELSGERPLGFAEADGAAAGNGQTRAIEAASLKAAKKLFRPEFLNRLDAALVFKPLGKPEITLITAMELAGLRSRIEAAYPGKYTLETDAEDLNTLVERTGWRKTGGREVRRAVQEYAETPIASAILEGAPAGTVFRIGQGTGDRGQRTEDRGQRTEDRGQGTGDSIRSGRKLSTAADSACSTPLPDKQPPSTLCSLPPAPCSLLPTPYPLPPTSCSLPPTSCSLPPTPYPLLPILALLLAAFMLPAFNGCVGSGAISAEEYYSIGMAYFDIGKYSEAETWLIRAAQADKTMRASEYNLGRIAFEQGRYSEASKRFEKIVKNDPKNAMALKALAYTYIKMAKLEEAETTYAKVLELEPESADEGYNYSLVLFALEKYVECEEVLQKYNYNLSENKDTLLMLARSQKAQKKIEAIDTYDLWLQKNKDPQVRYEYAALLEENTFFARAIEQMKQAISEMGADTAKLKKSTLQFYYAQLLLTADPNNPDALKEFEAALNAGFNDQDAVKKLLADNRITKANKDAVQRLLDAGLKVPEPETKEPAKTKTEGAGTGTEAEKKETAG